MWIFANRKLWEILLVIAICILCALVYEVHNAPGRYVTFDGVYNGVLDTSTGKVWKWSKEKGWETHRPVIPNRSHSLE